MRNVFWGIILIIFGVLFLLDNMDVIDFAEAIRTYWPVLLILWGLSILLKKRELQAPHVFRDVKQQATGELFHESSVFGDVVVSIDSQNFKGGSVSTVFGGIHIDLTRAAIAEGEHWMRIHGVFGDVTVILPKHLACSLATNVLFGDIEAFDQKRSGFSTDLQYVSPHYDTATNRLRITISQVFGTVRIS
jgi:predicted membrane protein